MLNMFTTVNMNRTAGTWNKIAEHNEFSYCILQVTGEQQAFSEQQFQSVHYSSTAHKQIRISSTATLRKILTRAH